MSVQDEKTALRRVLADARRSLSHQERLRRSHALVTHLLAAVDGARVVGAYWPMPTEPGAEVLIPALRRAVDTLWLPVSLPDGTLAWAEDTGDAAMSLHGSLNIPEPSGPRVPTSSLATADALVLPALGCTPSGLRLGKGAGYYDRALATLPDSPRPTLITLVNEEEIRADVPTEAHDMPVDVIVTEQGIHHC